MGLLGRWLAYGGVATALVASGLTVAPAAAETLYCEVIYADGEVLELRADKAHPVWVDCDGTAEDYDVVVTDGPDHGTVGPVAWDPELYHHVVRYEPDTGYVGTDQISFSVSDGTVTEVLVLDIDVAPNRAPGCDGQDVEFGHGEVGEVLTWEIPCSDLDLQDMELSAVMPQEPEHGSVEVRMGTDQVGTPALLVSYTPEPGFVGTDDFAAGVTDDDLVTTSTFLVYVGFAEDPSVLMVAVPPQSPRPVARRGLKAELTVVADAEATVALRVPERVARRLGLRRTRIGQVTLPVDAGVSPVVVPLGRRAAPAVRTARRVPVHIEVGAADEWGHKLVQTARTVLRSRQ